MANDTVFRRFPRPLPELPAASAAGGKAVLPFFGGDQEWFAGYVARLSGCGPVAAANAFACFAAGDPALADTLGIHPTPDGLVDQDAYKAFMERVYDVVRTRQIRFLCDYVDGRHARAAALLASDDEADRQRGDALLKSLLSHLPCTFGNSARSLRRGVDRFAASLDIPLLWRVQKTRRLGHDEGLAFIEEALSAHAPVIFLNHFNRVEVFCHGHRFTDSPRPAENPTMHFMTITGLREKKGDTEFILSDGGFLATVSYQQLHASWQTAGTLGGALLWFTVAAPAAEPDPVSIEDAFLESELWHPPRTART